MKRILVISDTHKNKNILKEVLEKCVKNIDIVIHLGDYYEDIEGFELLLEGKEIYQVPGIYHPKYQNGLLPAVKNIKIEDWDISFVHKLEDLLKKKLIGDINLYGHTHRSDVFTNDGKIFLNPRHLKNYIDRDRSASYAIMEITQKSVSIKIMNLADIIIKEKIIEKTEE